MKTTTPNARFWEFINGSPVKLTLKPGQTLHHFTGSPTDEGWSSLEQTWEFDGKAVWYTFRSDGVDCDGRLTRGGDYVAVLSQLNKRIGCAPDISFPQWTQSEDSYQRDQYAEAMGY